MRMIKGWNYKYEIIKIIRQIKDWLLGLFLGQ